MSPQWNTTDRGKTREDQFETSYGDGSSEGDWDGKSCSDYSQIPGRGVRCVEELTMLSGLQADAETPDDQGRQS